jgi:hypothetical protein
VVEWEDNRELETGNATLLVDGQPRSFTPFAASVEASVGELDPGEHTITVSVADESGNVAEETWTFEVAGEDDGLVEDVREVPGAGLVGVIAALATGLAWRRRRNRSST